MKPELRDRLLEIIQEDRQWLRSQRLQHARLMQKQAVNPDDKAIWDEVIRLNSY